MNVKVTIFFALFLTLTLGLVSKSNAQTVTAVATNSNCPEQGKITASTSGFAAPIVGYQLKQGANVVRPIGGSGFQVSNEFLDLPAGTYTVVADDGNTVKESDQVTVAINYTQITASVAPGTVSCASATSSLTVNALNGSGDYLYAITPTSVVTVPANADFQASPTFNGLTVGSYKFWVKDNGCTTGTTINTTGAVNNVPAPDVSAFGLSVLPSLTFASPNNHLSGYRVSIGRFTRGATAMSAAEAASYTVEMMDGPLSIAGPVAVSAVGSTNIPVSNGLVGHSLTVILKNTCTGNIKTFTVSQLGPGMHLLATCPGAQAMYRLLSYSLVALPATITYVNQDGTGNGNQTIYRTTANDQYNYVNFPPNSKFDWKVVDAANVEWTGEHDFTTSLVTSASQWNSYINNCALRQGSIELIMTGVKNSTPIKYEILEAPVGSEALIGHQDITWAGWKNDYTLVLNGQSYFPKGRYRIRFIDEGCYNGREMVVNANGNEATVTGITKTPNCSSFDFKINGTFGTGFEQYIISGPAGTVGLVKASTETFTSLPYGTYKVGLRIRNASCNIFEETFTYTAESSIDFDALNSGGFTCIAGGKGDLHVVASTTMAGATLEYSINGVDFQTSNVFTNLDEGSYNVTIRETKCGSLRTVNVAIISSINATINNQITSTVVCEGAPVALNINAIGGIKYTWTYPDGSQHDGKIQNFPSATSSMAGKYSVVVETASCITTPYEVILKVNTKPTVNPIAVQTACVGVEKKIAITGVVGKEFTSATTSTDLPANYSWTNDNPSIGLAASGTGDIVFIPVNTTLLPIVANIKVTPLGAVACDGSAITFSITVNPALVTPIITAATATTFCAGGSVVLNSSSATGNQWYKDGGIITGEANQTYTANTSGIYTVVLTTTGCPSVPSAGTTVTVNPIVATPIVITTAATCAEAGTATINNYVASQTYVFSPVGLSVGAGGVINGMTPGVVYTVSTSNGNCNSAASAGFSIEEMLSPAAAATVTVTLATCSAAGTAKINDYVAGNTYIFSPTGPAVGAGGLISGMIPGTSYTVTTNNGSCSSSASSPFSIGAMLPAPVASISYNPAEYQATGTATVIQTGQTGGTYTASPVGLSINPTTGEINLAASTPNQSYTVTYSFSNGSCTGTTTTIVKINSRAATIAYANPAYCAVSTASVIRTGPQEGIYSASPAGLSINPTTGEINLATSKPGLYTITYSYQDGTITSSSTTTITVNALPTITITTDIPTGNSITLGDVVTITATGGATYSWSGDDIQSGQNTNVIKARPRLATTYKVTVTNANGCSETMEITINLVAGMKFTPNNVITPNGDGKNDFWVVKNLDYYPQNTVNVYDRAGRRVYSAKGYKNDWDGTYNGQPLAEGAYVYVIDLGTSISPLRGTVNIIRDQR